MQRRSRSADRQINAALFIIALRFSNQMSPRAFSHAQRFFEARRSKAPPIFVLILVAHAKQHVGVAEVVLSKRSASSQHGGAALGTSDTANFTKGHSRRLPGDAKHAMKVRARPSGGTTLK